MFRDGLPPFPRGFFHSAGLADEAGGRLEKNGPFEIEAPSRRGKGGGSARDALGRWMESVAALLFRKIDEKNYRISQTQTDAG